MWEFDYVVCYEDKNGKQIWEGISGEDAMNERVCELEDKLGLDVLVFDLHDHL
jgi:hypothetical protein